MGSQSYNFPTKVIRADVITRYTEKVSKDFHLAEKSNESELIFHLSTPYLLFKEELLEPCILFFIF